MCYETQNEISALARKMSERLPISKTQKGLKDFSETLTKFTVERALNAELEHYLESEEAHTRHLPGRFTRRTKAISRKEFMVNLTLRIWHAVITGTDLFLQLQKTALSIFR